MNLNQFNMKLFKKIKNIISSTILCIRFPFLYPRNRFDGAHHAHLLSKWSYKLKRKARQEIGISAKVNKSDDIAMPAKRNSPFNIVYTLFSAEYG